jgi:perosamine synthetase
MIPVNEPVLGEQELELATQCIRTGWISSAGAFIEQFEREWAAFCGMKYGVAVSNGTVALQVAVDCLNLAAGDEVIMPSFTIVSCAGGVPVLVDSDPRTWGMDVNQVAGRITVRTRAIMPVHMYGHPVDMDPLLELAEQRGLAIVEDAAEAHGAEYLSRRNEEPAWRRCGGMSDLSTFSFYANKLVTTGEGGMVLTNDSCVADRARSLRNLCFRTERRFYHTELGYNFRLTNLQAALGVAQIQRMCQIVARKRWMGATYTDRLAGITGLQLPVEEPWARQVYWMYGLVLDESTGHDAVSFARRLRYGGVETRPFFLGMHEQPVFRQMGLFGGEHYPVAERLARQGLYLPSGLGLTEQQLEEVCTVVRRAL